MPKRKRTYNTNLIKKTKTYSVFEIADLFGIHKGSVLSWLKQGLPKIDDKRPFLVLGTHLEKFLKDRRSKRKQLCGQDELYCCKCRFPKKSKNNSVILVIFTPKKGLLQGICEECGTKIFKGVSLKNLAKIRETFPSIRIRDNNLIGLDYPIVNIDFKEGNSK